ncbi:putative adenylate/guanylate cyclase [Prosthecochloris aestuarii DSM 271]|uniref:Adenylate/guanylate cyclase n=1 Tax=Prosthecochloris aestuarii (strain DSM 271 / SK 413) TaxID=290512 RepID=B4S7E0_PROA2|nr:adenylate/guanylate cyclase domain-containing protein [Prosthecochloris aestuarii]ACF45977.1 putative adenylate/guanylate cyclase [Prosthecochloris aestuarii DSM 271]
MRISPNISRALKYFIWIVAGFMIAFYGYMVFIAVFSYAFHEQLYSIDPVLFLRFTLIGLWVGCIVALIDVFVLSRLVRGLNFLLTLTFATAFNAMVSLLALLCFVLVEDYLILLQNPGVFLLYDRLRIFFSGEFLVLLLYLPLVNFVINYVGLVVQRIGEKNFWNAIRGTYQIPHEEERVFMFLDLYASTALAERIGHRQYHDLLYDVFNEIAEPIALYAGEVYQYVGDSVVITWNIGDGTAQMNCIRCYFDIEERLRKAADRYRKQYGHVPVFKAGLHAGKVTAGEVGGEKREIVFHGDTVNTSARIQSECVELHEQILLSEELLFLFPVKLLKQFIIRFKGSISLKGRKSPVSLYAITRRR